MAKSFKKCPKCGKKGQYVIYGYLGGLPQGSTACRYCNHITVPKEKK